jgi:hypothetical protein
MEALDICAVTFANRTGRHRFVERWLDTVPRPRKRAGSTVRTFIHRPSSRRLKGDESSLVIKDGIEPPLSKTATDRAQSFQF